MTRSSSSDDSEWQQLKLRFKQLRASVKSRESDLKSQLDDLLAYYVSSFESAHRYEADNVLQILSGKNCAPEATAFLWLGAWRPSAAISLVFSVMGLQATDGFKVELRAEEPLSVQQCEQLNSLQKQCSAKEKELSDDLATVQMMLADQGVVTSVMMDKSGIREIMGSKVGSLSDVLKRADDLRIKTMVELHSLLNPMQASRCSLAAFEVAFAMRSLDPSARPSSSSSSSQRDASE